MRLEIAKVSVAIADTTILRDITVTVPEGSIVGLVGPNGSGKSTLLRTVYRALRPREGTILVGGDDVWKQRARASAKRTAAVAQDATADVVLTVRELVATGRTPHALRFSDSPTDVEVIDRALRHVGLLDLAHRSLAALSGGERQRAQLARAIAQEPRVLVLDEPTNHLDVRYQLELLDLVTSLDVTTVITLHDLNLAALYCETIVVLDHGRVVAAGEPEQVLHPDLLRSVFGVSATPVRHPVTGRVHLLFERGHHVGE